MTPDLETRLSRLADLARDARSELRCDVEWGGRTLTTYNAGRRRGEVRFGPFGRDLLISALLLGDEAFTRDALRFVAATLGRTADPQTGEEPGRAIHEFRDVATRGQSTRYDAAEASLLFLIAADDYSEREAGDAVLDELHGSLRAAVQYVRRHMVDGLFVEDPAFCGASRYALRATYWKDSHLPGRDDPAYPVVYSLAQAQAIAALRAARDLAWRCGESWGEWIDSLTAEATRALNTTLWDAEEGRPWIAVDRQGPVGGLASDALHILAYLQEGDLRSCRVRSIAEQAEQLATPVGLRTFAPGQAEYDRRAYHLGAIWPFEQAALAWGAERHGCAEIVDVACRVAAALESVGFAELVYWSDESGLEGALAEDDGCDLQLWSTCAPTSLARSLRRVSSSGGCGTTECRA